MPLVCPPWASRSRSNPEGNARRLGAAGEEDLGRDEAARAGLLFPAPMASGAVVLLDDAVGEGRAGGCCSAASGGRALGQSRPRLPAGACRLLQEPLRCSRVVQLRLILVLAARWGSGQGLVRGSIPCAGFSALSLLAVAKHRRVARAWADVSFLMLGLSKCKCGFSPWEDFCCCKRNMAESC